MLGNLKTAHSVRTLIFLAVVLMVGLALGASEAQGRAANCGYGDPTKGTMWRVSVSPGYWYTIEVTNLGSYEGDVLDVNPHGSVYLEVWGDCWRDSFGSWPCHGFAGQSGPWTRWASYTFYATDFTYYARVATKGNSYRICVY